MCVEVAQLHNKQMYAVVFALGDETRNNDAIVAGLSQPSRPPLVRRQRWTSRRSDINAIGTMSACMHVRMCDV